MWANRVLTGFFLYSILFDAVNLSVQPVIFSALLLCTILVTIACIATCYQQAKPKPRKSLNWRA